jgi:3-oxochol-4-en-24-oyl-CoA dehydrogenase
MTGQRECVVGELRAVTRSFLKEKSPELTVRTLMETPDGNDPEVWVLACRELGIAGLVVPEEQGGLASGTTELGAVFAESGRVLWCSPLLATSALATSALLAVDGEPACLLLGQIVSAEITATLAWAGTRPATSTLQAHPHGSTWRISGTAGYVVDGASADVVLIAAEAAEAGTALFMVRRDDGAPAGLETRRLAVMDSTRKLAELTFRDVTATLVCADAASALERAMDRADLLFAAEQLGAAERILEIAVQYAKMRIQFGRAIGSFQAVKHKLADMLVGVESARATVDHGLCVADESPEQLAVAASLSRSLTGEVFLQVAADNIQVHGGIGFTWEHPAHLYLKRAKSSQLLFGSLKWHRSRLGDLLGIPAANACEGVR